MKITKNYNLPDNQRLVVQIRLDDACKNGHDDFAITGTLFEGDRDIISGCIHEEILKADPSLKAFVDLHLHDSYGAAMHCVGNAWFWLKRDNKPQNTQTMLSLTDEELAALIAANHECEDEFHVWIDENRLPDRWLAKANHAIGMLETLTGVKYVRPAATRTHYQAPTPETIINIVERRNSGYYADDAKAQRAQDAAAKAKAERLLKIDGDRRAAIKKAEDEYLVKSYFINRGYPADKMINIIYYTHSKTIAFNWATCYPRWTREEFEVVRAEFSADELPVGAMLEFK